MPANYVAIRDSDARVKVPQVAHERDYHGMLYELDNPPAIFRLRLPFRLPDRVEADTREPVIVSFMLDPTNDADMPYEVWLNDVRIMAPHPQGGVARGVWEIVREVPLSRAPTNNEVEFRVLPQSDSRGFLNFSDVVVWFKSN